MDAAGGLAREHVYCRLVTLCLGIIEVKKSLASAVAANRVEDVRRLLLRLRQEVVATEDLIKVTVLYCIRSRSFSGS